jgi:hypothetical protein
VIPARSRNSSSGIATRRVVPRACRASAAVNGCGSRARARAAWASAPGASTICSVTRSSRPARAAAPRARPSRPSSRSRPASGAMNGASARSASTVRTPAITWGGSVGAGAWAWGAFCGSSRRRYPPSSHTRDGAPSGAASDACGRARASTSVRSGSRRAARAASGGRPMASGSRRACAATTSASWRRSSPQRAGSASQPLAMTGGGRLDTFPGPSPAVTPMAAIALARSRPWRRSRSAAVGRSGQAASSRPAAAAAPRRTSSGGATSSTVAPRMVTPALPGSRSSSRSPTCSGSG